MSRNPKVYLDITIGGRATGRIVIELFKDITPFTAENFRGLCTGDYGKNPAGVSLSYLDSLFYQVIKKRYCIGGDIAHNTGQGGASIYGPRFMDENFDRKHAHAGLLSMFSRGPNTNSSCFMLTFDACPDLDNKQVVCGQIVDGMSVVRAIEQVATDNRDRPIHTVRVFKCGELDDDRDHIKFEEFADQIRVYRGIMERQAQKREQHLRAYYDLIRQRDVKIEVYKPVPVGLPEERGDSDEEELQVADPALQERLQQLKEGLRAAAQDNKELAQEEHLLQTDASFKKAVKASDWKQTQAVFYQRLELLGIPPEKKYLLDSAAKVSHYEHERKKKAKRVQQSGEFFSTDALLKSFKKRLRNLEFDQEEYHRQMQNPDQPVELKQERVELMAEELIAEQQRKAKFSRRRPFYEDMDISYINERNRVYNAKLVRHFKDHAAEFKASIDRGTAI